MNSTYFSSAKLTRVTYTSTNTIAIEKKINCL